MRKIEEYTVHAEECRQLARSSSNEESRRQLLGMAETWEALARDRKAQIERDKRIADMESGSKS